EAGEFIGVLGPNGAGKTTLMRAALGLVSPRAGSIRVMGRPATRGNPAVGYMPQARNTAASRLAGRDSVAHAARGHRRGLPRLDPTHQRGVVELVGRVQKDLGIAVMFSAHELNPLLNAVDRVLYLGNGQAVLGSIEEVITGPVLSRLYGSQIEVLRHGGRIFVM